MVSLPSLRISLLVSVLCAAGALCSFAQSDAPTRPLAQDSEASQATPATAATTAETTISTATPPAQLFANASADYAAADYAAAATQFAALTETTPSFAAYYNLGNAYFRLGRYGDAIAAYEKARALNPAQADVLANLSRARDAARVQVPPAGHWEQYARKLSPNGWTILVAVSFWVALALWLIPAQFRRSYGIWRPALLTLAVAVLLFAIAGLYPWRQMSRSGTILGADTPLLLAPVATSPVQTYAQAGQSAELIGTHGNFDRIRLPDGSVGWVAQSQFSTTWNLRR